MLLSPGHSPRHVSTPTPSSSSQTLTLTNSPITAATTPSPNPSSKKRGPAVLDEDTYVASIEKIIERDFFPDIPKLRDRLDWLEAVRSGDPVLIRDAQLKILDRRRRSSQNPNPNNTSSTPFSSSNTQNRTQSHTPGFRSATPFASDPTHSIPNDGSRGGHQQIPNDDPERSDDVDIDLPLDDFFKRYTSEDNESFSKILEKVNRKRKEKYSHLIQAEKGQTLAIEDEKMDRITDGYGTSGQPVSTLDGWNYTAKNLLMYNPEDRFEVALTEDERVERLKGLTKEISRTNTRFHGKSVADARPTKEEEAVAILYAPVPGTTPAGAAWPFADREADKSKKYDLEDLRKTPNQFFVESSKKAENGYSFVKTPSPAPGVDESPFMTWGEIEGTPLRLDLEESPVGTGGSSGPQFRIPLPPTRDLKAHSLSREAARKVRERSKMFRKPPLLPSPSRGGSASPSVRTLSPAAQKFVRNAIAKSSRSVDETLRASYRGASPAVGTPKDKLSRFSRDGSFGSRSPSAASQGTTPPW